MRNELDDESGIDGGQEPKTSSAGISTTASTSKIESLRREDLLAIVKKQYISLNAIKKQLEEYKAEIAEKNECLDELKAIKNDDSAGASAADMLSIELNDYKRSLENVRKTLSERQVELEKKTQMLQEMTEKYEEVLKEKESTVESLRASITEKSEMKQLLEEKSKLISENSKQIDALVFEVSALKSQMEAEIIRLNDELDKKNRQLAESKHSEHKLTGEYRQVKNELTFLEQKHTTLSQEYAQFKSRAEHLLNLQSSQNKNSGEKDQHQNKSIEVRELIETMNIKNEEIAQIRSRYSILDEELQITRKDIANLESQILAERERHAAEINQERNTNQKILSQLEQHSEGYREIAARQAAELAAMRDDNDARLTALTQKWQERVEALQRENLSLQDELKNVRAELSNHVIENIKPKRNQENTSFMRRDNEVEPPKAFNKFLHPTTSINDFFNEDETDANSESEDEEPSLQSIINGADEEPTMQSVDGKGGWRWEVNREEMLQQENETLKEKVASLESQLSHTRDLLAETEKTNIKLEEQVQLFKEEIRRVERNHERESHINKNSEYLKNVILSFLAPQRVNDERLQMLPVLKTMLKLTSEEVNAVENHVHATSVASNDIKAGADWGSYLGLKGLF